MIRIRDLTVRYPQARAPSLRKVHISLDSGELLLVLGPSGSGKSTLALALSGLIPHSVYAEVSGEIEVDGIHPQRSTAAVCATHVGLLFQDPQAGFATLTVEDEIAFGLENLRVPRSQMHARIRRGLESAGLSRARRRDLTTLSAGEAQRVSLAALLAMDPFVLVLDEPTSHLDPASTREFFVTLARLKHSHTIVLIEHKLDACLPLADRVLLLRPQGSQLAEGRPGPVFRRFRKAILDSGSWLPSSLEPKRRTRSTPASLSARNDSPAVSLVNFSYAYPGGPGVLHNVKLDVRASGFLALVGPNGSGKSTLARALLKLLPGQSQAEIQLFGVPLSEWKAADLARRVGLVFQNPEDQFVRNTVWEEMAYGQEDIPPATRSRTIEAALARFHLRGLEDRNPFTLSQGEKRRLSVAEMIAGGQRLLILDEPTFGQDRASTWALMDTLSGLQARGVTVIVITHDMRFIRSHAEAVAVMLAGRVIYQGTPGELFRRPRLMDRARLR